MLSSSFPRHLHPCDIHANTHRYTYIKKIKKNLLQLARSPEATNAQTKDPNPLAAVILQVTLQPVCKRLSAMKVRMANLQRPMGIASLEI